MERESLLKRLLAKLSKRGKEGGKTATPNPANPLPVKAEGGSRPSALIIIASTAGLVLLALILAVVITSLRVVRLQPTDPNKTVVKLDSPKESVSLNLRGIEAATSREREVALLERELTSAVIRLLYNQELEHSKGAVSLLEAVREALPFNQPPLPLTPLSSIEEVESLVRGELKDKKEEIQRSYGINNWPTEWGKILASKEYGSSLSEEEALRYRVDRRLAEAAFAPSQLELNTSFSPLYLSEVTLKGDVTVRGGGGERLLHKAGSKVRLDFLNHAFKEQEPTSPTTAKLAAILSKGWDLGRRDRLASFEDFLARDQQLTWFLKLPISLTRTLTGVSFKVTPNDLAALLTLIPTSFSLPSPSSPSLSAPITLLELAASLSSGNLPTTPKPGRATRLTRQELTDLLLANLGEGSDPSGSKGGANLAGGSLEGEGGGDGSTLESRFNSRKLGYESLSTSDLLTLLPEVAPTLLTRLFKPAGLAANLFTDLANDLYGSFGLARPSKALTLAQLEGLNNSNKAKLLAIPQAELEARFSSILSRRLGVSPEGGLRSGFKVGTLTLIPRSDYLLLLRGIDRASLRAILAEQLGRTSLPARPEDLDLTALFKDYTNRLAGPSSERLILKTLGDPKLGGELVKLAGSQVKEGDIDLVIRQLQARLRSQDTARLTALVTSLSSNLLSPTMVATNPDLRQAGSQVSFSYLAPSITKEAKGDNNPLRLISLELRRLLGGGRG